MGVRDINSLEWLGVELALNRYFFSQRQHCRILATLIRHAGLTVRSEEIVKNTAYAADAMKVHICHLRQAMEDLGFACKIENVKGAGYRLSESGAAEIMARIVATLDYVAEAA